MFIQKIEVSNFKSFNRLSLELNDFNVLIGGNASGKSNFVNIFSFLRDISNHGLQNAISMQGGALFLLNMRNSLDDPLTFKIIFTQNQDFTIEYNKKTLEIQNKSTSYDFSLKFLNENNEFEIIHEKLEIKSTINDQSQKIGTIDLQINRKSDTYEINVESNPDNIISKSEILPEYVINQKIKSNKLLLESPSFLIPIFDDSFSNFSAYDIEPKLSKKASKISGKAELEEDGNNISIVLNKLLNNTENKRKFSNIIEDILPFVKNIDVEKLSDKSLIFRLQEEYLDNYLPASFLSDGTINITALIIALYFENKQLIVFEEPERNIHPALMSKIMTLFQESSQKKQIILTTHNPIILKNVELENVLLINRNEEGFSDINKPSESDQIKIFIDNEIGIDELFSENLLGV